MRTKSPAPAAGFGVRPRCVAIMPAGPESFVIGYTPVNSYGTVSLEFIEFRLFWEGHVNRGDLMSAFGVSVNQASTDLNRYIGMAPHNIHYDKSARAYVQAEAFAPLYLKPDASRYLAQLRSVADGILDRADAWIGQFPSYDAAPTPVRGVNAKTLRSVIAAIRRSEAIEVKYQSLSLPEPRWRWIAPHAIGFDGFRWHTRAFCLTDLSFKDFLLSRIIETRATKQSEAKSKSDADWNEQVTLEIGLQSQPIRPPVRSLVFT